MYSTSASTILVHKGIQSLKLQTNRNLGERRLPRGEYTRSFAVLYKRIYSANQQPRLNRKLNISERITGQKFPLKLQI